MNLKSLWAKVKLALASYPAASAWLVNGGVASLLAFVFHLGTVQEAAVTTITTAAAAAYTAWRARPIAYSVLIGSLATIATAAGAFGLLLPPAAIATGVGVLSLLVGQLFHANLTPRIRTAASAPPVR